jgi:hypothetical protein
MTLYESGPFAAFPPLSSAKSEEGPDPVLAMKTSAALRMIYSNAETDQLKLWRGEFGSAYTARNDRELSARTEAFRQMLGGLPIARIVEVGCNVGWNLSYLNALGGYSKRRENEDTSASCRAPPLSFPSPMPPSTSPLRQES